jgi:hypothetical protein
MSSRTTWRRATTARRLVAERHGLLVIITLGEGVLGTVVALSALVHTERGWTLDAALLAVGGIGVTFGPWWMYFVVPWGETLERHRERSRAWELPRHLRLPARWNSSPIETLKLASSIRGDAFTRGKRVAAVARFLMFFTRSALRGLIRPSGGGGHESGD